MARAAPLFAGPMAKLAEAFAAAGPDSPSAWALYRKELAKASARVRPALVRLMRAIEAEQFPQARLALWGDRIVERTTLLARERFGETAEILVTERPEAALAALNERRAAVLSVRSGGPWWGRLLARPNLAVVGVLPETCPLSMIEALVVAEARPEPSGLDVTFWATDQAGSAAEILEGLSAAGFGAELAAEAGGLKLFGLAGFVQRDDPRLVDAPGQLKGVVGTAALFLDL